MTTLTVPPRTHTRPCPIRADINHELRQGHTVVIMTRVNAREHRPSQVYHPWARH